MASSILLPLTPSRIFAPDFGARKMQKDMSILDMPTRNLIPAWEACIRDMVEMQVALQDELAKSARANVSGLSSNLHDLKGPSTGRPL
jgi:hypothetical protein